MVWEKKVSPGAKNLWMLPLRVRPTATRGGPWNLNSGLFRNSERILNPFLSYWASSFAVEFVPDGRLSSSCPRARSSTSSIIFLELIPLLMRLRKAQLSTSGRAASNLSLWGSPYLAPSSVNSVVLADPYRCGSLLFPSVKEGGRKDVMKGEASERRHLIELDGVVTFIAPFLLVAN